MLLATRVIQLDLILLLIMYNFVSHLWDKSKWVKHYTVVSGLVLLANVGVLSANVAKVAFLAVGKCDVSVTHINAAGEREVQVSKNT